MKTLTVLFLLAFNFSAHAFTPDFSYDCEKFVKVDSHSGDFVKDEDNFKLMIGLNSGFLGWGPAWMSLTNKRTGSYLRFDIAACSERTSTDTFLIDDRCADLYRGDEFGYFLKDGRRTADADGLPTWVNSNLRLSASAIKGAPTVKLSTSEYGGENPDGSVNVVNTEWRCEREQ